MDDDLDDHDHDNDDGGDLIDGSNNNNVYSPCADTTVERSDGFTFGIAFASKESFQRNGTVQLSPCDSRLSLSSNAQISVFHPKLTRSPSSPSTPPPSIRILMGLWLRLPGVNMLQGPFLLLLPMLPTLSPALPLCLSSIRAGCRTCTGKRMGAPNVQGAPALFASTISTARSRPRAA